jgi:hypothetical protein
VLKFFSRIKSDGTREETFLASLFDFPLTMSAVRDEHSYVLAVRRFRDAKPFDDFHRPAQSAESALRLASHSGVGMKPQSPRTAQLFYDVIVIAPLALDFLVLRVRPPFLHILAFARAPFFA